MRATKTEFRIAPGRNGRQKRALPKLTSETEATEKRARIGPRQNGDLDRALPKRTPERGPTGNAIAIGAVQKRIPELEAVKKGPWGYREWGFCGRFVIFLGILGQARKSPLTPRRYIFDSPYLALAYSDSPD